MNIMICMIILIKYFKISELIFKLINIFKIKENDRKCKSQIDYLNIFLFDFLEFFELLGNLFI